MNSVEFGEQYTQHDPYFQQTEKVDGHEQNLITPSLDRVTTALTLGMLGVQNYDLNIPPARRSRIIEKNIDHTFWYHPQIRAYFAGQYVPEYEKNGLGNPTQFLLNAAFVDTWLEIDRQLIKNDQISEPLVRKIPGMASSWLRAMGAALLYQRYKLISQNYNRNEDAYLEDTNSTAKAHIEGALNEIEAGIVLLDMADSNKTIIVPAPALFERGKGTNIDYLVFQPETSSTAGVQVKANVENTRNIRSRFIDKSTVVIDGFTDFENYKNVFYRDDRGKPCNRKISFAGSILRDVLRYHNGLTNMIIPEGLKESAFKYYLNSIINKPGKPNRNNLKTNHARRVNHIEAKINEALAAESVVTR